MQTPLLFAAGIMVLMGLGYWVRIRHSPCQNYWRRYPVAGFLLTASIPSLAVLLTIFKSGLHAHGFLEFTWSELVRALRLTPILGLGGLVLGLSLSLGCRRAKLKRN